MATNDEWLAQTQEDIIDPELPICDPHHHLWGHRDCNIEPRYLMEEIQQDVQSGHNIVATVFIECNAMYRASGPKGMQPVGEIEFANGVAAMAESGAYGKTKIAAGIIGFADLQLGSRVKGVLEAQIAAAPNRFRGIRRTGAWDADPMISSGAGVTGPGLYMDNIFREGLAEIAPLDLIFEGVCRHPQIPEFQNLAYTFPDTTMVLNHIGSIAGVGRYAGKQDEIFESWKKDMFNLATCPNVVVKLGGINRDYNGFGWHGKPMPPNSQELCEVTKRYYEIVIEYFGADRCMFESNFPVDKVSCSYAGLWNSFKRLATNYSANERAQLFHDTAARVYRL
jgi:L-fuconolactonase